MKRGVRTPSFAMDPHTQHARGMMVETVPEETEAPVAVVPSSPVERPQFAPGAFRSSLRSKMGLEVVPDEQVEEHSIPPSVPQEEVPTQQPAVESIDQPEPEVIGVSSPTEEVPNWMSPHASTPGEEIQTVEPKTEGVVPPTTGFALPNLKDMNTLVMNAPTFITLAAVVSAFAFFTGRFSSSASKQVNAQATPAVQEIQLKSSQQNDVPVLGTPDEIISKAHGEFAKAQEMSKNASQTDAQKQEISRTIVGILDLLTQGIKSYPDVAALYFERAQVEKMVMQSAQTLKMQAATDYQKAIEISPLTAQYYLGYADYLQVAGDNTGAVQNFQKSVQLDPKNPDALYSLAKLQVTLGMKEDALHSYESLLLLIPQGSPYYASIVQEKNGLVSPIAAPTSDGMASSSATPGL
jgi:hypothetical protein